MKKLLTCLLVFCTIQYTNAQSCADGSFSFDDDIAPILVANCGGCHGNGMTTGGNGGYNVFTYNNVLAGGNMCGSAVTPGDATPTASSIIDKTQWAIGNPDATCGGNMPANGIPLTMADYMAIETWIAAGAQEACPANPCDMAAVLACGDNITDSDGVEPVPAITCGAGGDGGNGFWYTFAGTGDDITIDLSASDYDTQIAVYDGTCAALNCIVGDDDSGAGTTSLATFTSTAGTDYLIYVDGFGGATGNLGLSVTCTPPPTQCTPGIADNTGVGCDNAINICGECSVSGTNVGNGPASDFCAVPACTGADGDSASWLTFVGDGGTYTFNTNGSDFDTQIAVFTDDGAGCLACEGGDDDGGIGTQSAVTIATTAGTTYFIVVDGFGASTGNWILNITDGTGVDGAGNPLAIACPSAPAACPAVAAACPTSDFVAPTVITSVCDGTILTYPMAGGVDFNIDDPDATQLGGMMWFDANDPTTANPVTTTDPTAHSGADPCATDPAVTHFAFVQCDADLDGTFDLAAGDSWIEVATLSFEVYAPAQMPTITRDDDVCNYTITEACTGDVLDMTSTNAAPGDDPAAITVNVTTANNCMGSFMVDPELCPAPGCTASASTIATTDPTRICVDGIGDPIDVSIDVAGMGTGAWVITDDMNIILALPPAPPFDLDGAGPGTCLIWYVNSDDAAFDPMVGDDAAAIVAASSCAFLSNPITVDRIEVTAPTISSAGPSVICADDGIPDLIPVDVDDAGIGASSAWVIADAAGIILALPPAPPFDLEGAGAGTCLIWLVNFDDPDFSPMAGDNAAAVVAAATCAVLSTPISVEREINCGVCEEEVTYNVFAPSCDMTGAVIELFDAGGTSLGTMPLGSEGGNGTFGLQPCGNYTMAIMGAPACYTDAGGEVGPIAFTTDGGGISNQTFTTIVNDIPTVGEWGLIILGLLMSITAVVGIRQRREEEVYG